MGEFDVLIGINLLREGLDLPEVSLVAILDADKEGFLRSERSLVQTFGRAARNIDGQVIMYAREITDSMERAITETERRRKIQEAHNRKYKIKPRTIRKAVHGVIEATHLAEAEESWAYLPTMDELKSGNRRQLIKDLRRKMDTAARELDFEKAAEIRDLIFELEEGAV